MRRYSSSQFYSLSVLLVLLRTDDIYTFLAPNIRLRSVQNCAKTYAQVQCCTAALIETGKPWCDTQMYSLDDRSGRRVWFHCTSPLDTDSCSHSQSLRMSTARINPRIQVDFNPHSLHRIDDYLFHRVTHAQRAAFCEISPDRLQ